LNNFATNILNLYNVNLNLNVGYNLPLDILTNILKHQDNNNIEEDDRGLNTVKAGLEELIRTISGLVAKEQEINIKDDKVNEVVGNIAAVLSERNNFETETNGWKLKYTDLEEEGRLKSLEIERLNDKIKTLTVKLRSQPLMPVLNYEKYMDKLTTHDCICYVCAVEMKNEGNTSDIEMKDANLLTTQEIDAVRNSEVEGVQALNEKLVVIIEKFKFELEVTEERLINSKAFRHLVNQAEAVVTEMEALKEVNMELQKQKLDILREKENEFRVYEQRVVEVISKYEEKVLETLNVNEANRLKMEAMNQKIEALQNLIRAKDTFDVKKLASEYEEDKQKIYKKLESCRSEKDELNRKYLELLEQSEQQERAVARLTQEVEKMKISLSKFETMQFAQDGSYIPTHEKFSSQEREEFKRNIAVKKDLLVKLEAKLKKVTGELKDADKNNENLLNEVVLTETYTEQLKAKDNSLKIELKELRETMAKMTNEKSKDTFTIKLLNEQKESLEQRIRDQEAQIENYIEYSRKLDQEILIIKQIKLREEAQGKLKQDESEILRKELTKMLKSCEEYRLQAEQTNQALVKSLESNGKYIANFEQMKIKFENLCRMKNVSSEGQMTSEEVEKELKILQIENKNFKVRYLYYN
jgi:hypothetical protein